jgi:transposase
MPPSTPKKKHLTRDERLRIQTLRSINMSYGDIARHLHVTERQVQHACGTEHPTPLKRSGRPGLLSNEQKRVLIEFVCLSKLNRRLTYTQLSAAFDWDVSVYAIRHALQKAGFKRYAARAKPPISEQNRVNRLAWARDHLNWTREQWCAILWTDETWVTAGRHTKTWITRRPGEELDPTCIVEKIPKKKGWMFWGSFNGATKGPCLFWEKEWGSINQQTYCERIVPLIHGRIRMNPHLQLMQDGAPGHAAGDAKQELEERGISVIFWPAYSPDLNPIETVWNQMKDYIQDKFPEKLSYDQLRNAVREAWDTITVRQLGELIDSMRERCQAVIDANGMHTKF